MKTEIVKEKKEPVYVTSNPEWIHVDTMFGVKETFILKLSNHIKDLIDQDETDNVGKIIFVDNYTKLCELDNIVNPKVKYYGLRPNELEKEYGMSTVTKDFNREEKINYNSRKGIQLSSIICHDNYRSEKMILCINRIYDNNTIDFSILIDISTIIKSIISCTTEQEVNDLYNIYENYITFAVKVIQISSEIIANIKACDVNNKTQMMTDEAIRYIIDTLDNHNDSPILHEALSRMGIEVPNRENVEASKEFQNIILNNFGKSGLYELKSLIATMILFGGY